MMQLLNKKHTGGNVILKVDMAKAYDRVDWRFLNLVSKSFDFSDKVCKMIAECVETPWYLFMMNAKYKIFFKSHGGLWKGDILSPFLFILIKDVLSHMLKKAPDDTQIGQYFHPRGCPLVSHLLYADDMLLFVNREKIFLTKILKVFAKYEAWLGRAIKKEKSVVFMSSQTNSSRRRELLRFTGFSEG